MGKKEIRRPEDAAGVGPYARERERLVRLGTLRGWNVVDGEPDIRSWEVRTVSGRVLGTVQELLVDRDAGEVVMLDVDLTGTGRHAYVPIRIVEVDRANRVVRADSADLEEHEVDADREVALADDVADQRTVRYPDVTERVVARRPIVEETVVRRRDVEDPDTRL